MQYGKTHKTLLRDLRKKLSEILYKLILHYFQKKRN